jgi:hypothetical protein
MPRLGAPILQGVLDDTGRALAGDLRPFRCAWASMYYRKRTMG